MEKGILKSTWEIFLKEIQTILSILYLSMIGIGMLFNYKKYNSFGINIFEYADVFHFLIAPFQDLTIMYVAIMGILIPVSLYRLWKLISRRFPRIRVILSLGMSKKSWFEPIRFIILGLIFLYFISEFAQGYANFTRDNIELLPSIKITYSDNHSTEGKMLGKTQEVLFLYKENKIKVILITAAVKEIEFL
ncbi:MAG: hypothetical protein AAFR87_03240 [Bacteroidota bacterium]